MRAARKKAVSYNYNDDDDFEKDDEGKEDSFSGDDEDGDAAEFEPDAEEKSQGDLDTSDDDVEMDDDDFDLETEVVEESKPAKKNPKKRSDPAQLKNSKPKKPSNVKKATKTPTLGEKESYNAIRDYMVKANRPYSVINVYDNLHRSVSKPLATKVLEILVDE